MRKILLAVMSGVLVLLLMITATGCGKSAKTQSTADYASVSAGSMGGKADAARNSESVQGAAANKGADINTANTKAVPEQNAVNDFKKIIKNANVSIEVKRVDEAFDEMAKWIGSNGGYEFNRNITERDKYKNANVVFKLSPNKLDDFLDFLGKVGRVTNSSTSSNDITDQYYDTAARLENLKKGRDQFLEIMKRAVTIDEILKVQNELNKVTGEIEALQGRITMWDKLVAESTVTIVMVEEADPLKVTKETSWRFSSAGDILKSMKNGFIITANTLINILIWILIIIVSASPVILICAVIFIIFRHIKARRKKTPVIKSEGPDISSKQ